MERLKDETGMNETGVKGGKSRVGAYTANPPGGGGPGPDDGASCMGSHKRITEKMREHRAAELHRLGAPEDGMAEQRWLRRARRWQACQSSLLPAGAFVRRSEGHFSPSPSIFQTKNKHLFHSDASKNQAHTKYRLLRVRLLPETLSPNPYLAARARARLSFPYR